MAKGKGTAYIGTGERLPSGGLVLRLRADDGEAVGHGTIQIKPTDPQFEFILDHLGRPEVGASFSVRPFPD